MRKLSFILCCLVSLGATAQTRDTMDLTCVSLSTHVSQYGFYTGFKFSYEVTIDGSDFAMIPAITYYHNHFLSKEPFMNNHLRVDLITFTHYHKAFDQTISMGTILSTVPITVIDYPYEVWSYLRFVSIKANREYDVDFFGNYFIIDPYVKLDVYFDREPVIRLGFNIKFELLEDS